MRSINSTFKTEKNAAENKPLFLYTIYDYDGSTDLLLAEADQNVTFAGNVYTRFPITHEFIEETNSGEINGVKVSLSNVSRLIQGYLEEHDFRGKKVKITLVWANQLADSSAKIEDIFFIDSYTADENHVEFTLSSKFNVLDVTLPLRKYMRNNCQWKFKGTECGYSGGETSCNRTLARCKELSNQLRYGGFPSIPSKRMYVG